MAGKFLAGVLIVTSILAVWLAHYAAPHAYGPEWLRIIRDIFLSSAVGVHIWRGRFI